MTLAGAAHADPEPCQLVWYAAAPPWLSLLASLQNACSRLADAVNGSKHDRYIALAMEREPTTHSSLNMLRWAVLADSEPMPTRLVRDYLACNRYGAMQPHPQHG